ncbi:iron uptake porin [Aerosakkonemataceae cyanobacterium BLCC-F154]|uniref:Iron uptake porin n=1 Tax=Floridaenema fluviatile BLCC-F154 TaxID=3153640 RepID=A0ABV4YEY3_9CYAN
MRRKFAQFLLGITSTILPFLGFDFSKAVATTKSLETLETELSLEQNDSMDRVTSVSQLADVNPSDWAFQALQSLVERYGCIAGYPDRTYRGNRALTRYEFASGLNACLDRILELINPNTTNLVSKEDLVILEKLQTEFANELAELRGRIDSLGTRISSLEKQQFSRTVKFSGDAVFAISDTFGDRDETKTIFSNVVRLNFSTSFTGKDLLRIRFGAFNGTPLNVSVTGTNMTRLGFDGNNNNNLQIQRLYYRFPIGKAVNVTLEAGGIEEPEHIPSFNPFLLPNFTGSISRFGRYSPIYRQGEGGKGIVTNIRLANPLILSLGYVARNAENPDDKKGLFNGNYAAIAQLAYQPNPKLGIGLTYTHSYYPSGQVMLSGATGSVLANQPFGNRVATSGDLFGIAATYRLNPKLNLSGWFGYTIANAQTANLASGISAGSNAEIIYWAFSLTFPDLGGKGNLASLLIGNPPKVISSDIKSNSDTGIFRDRDTSWHIEAMYRIRVTDNIFVTPGMFLILHPEHNANNDPILVGTIRTTFTF